MPSAPPAIASAVSRELAGERVLWAISPDRWAYTRRYWSNALIGIPISLFALSWLWPVDYVPAWNSRGFDAFIPLWSLLFIVTGLSMLLSPLWAAWTARNVYYVVTDRRAVIFEKKLRLGIRSYPRSAVVRYERISHGDRRGDVIFQRVLTRGGKSSKLYEYGFIGLADFAAAERALDQLIANGVP